MSVATSGYDFTDCILEVIEILIFAVSNDDGFRIKQIINDRLELGTVGRCILAHTLKKVFVFLSNDLDLGREGCYSIEHGSKLVLVAVILTLDANNASVVGEMDELASDISFFSREIVLDAYGDGVILVMLNASLQLSNTAIGNVVVSDESNESFEANFLTPFAVNDEAGMQKTPGLGFVSPICIRASVQGGKIFCDLFGSNLFGG
mmetsp:Transcript_23279/g.54999  ORF Transcript_23279/g.54999 Transcript_23279/m.54999 type:complete len:206 (+) Transcript_23279:257-874(+)